MNTYDFIKKGFGLEDLTSLNLYIQIPSHAGQTDEYQVTQIKPSAVSLLQHHRGKVSARMLSKGNTLRVSKVIIEKKSRLAVKPKVILILERITA